MAQMQRSTSAALYDEDSKGYKLISWPRLVFVPLLDNQYPSSRSTNNERSPSYNSRHDEMGRHVAKADKQ
eukprot:scaffold456_cov368-Pavlova_lutheri.AAC.17